MWRSQLSDEVRRDGFSVEAGIRRPPHRPVWVTCRYPPPAIGTTAIFNTGQPVLWRMTKGLHLQEPVNPKKAFRATALAAGRMDAGEKSTPDRAVTPYTLHRTMARLLRAQGVPMADIGAMLDHGIVGMEATEIFADADPMYVKPVVDGLERIVDLIAAHTKRAPLRVLKLTDTPTAPPQSKKPNIWTGHKGRNP